MSDWWTRNRRRILLIHSLSALNLGWQYKNIAQVVKIIWYKTALQSQMDGSVVFARWRQRALSSGHIGATWQIWLNLCFLRPTRVHNPNSKSIGSAIFAQLMADTLHWASLFPKIALPMGNLDPHVTHDSLGPSKPTTQAASWSVQPCLQGSIVWHRQTDRQTTLLGR